MVLPALAAGARATAKGAVATTRAAVRTGGRLGQDSKIPTLVQKPSRATLAGMRRQAPVLQAGGASQRTMSRMRNMLHARRAARGTGPIPYRIDRPTMFMMVGIALLFDIGQLLSKVLYLMGLALLGAAAGGYWFGSIGSWIGGALGGIATFLGVGFFINMIMAEFISWSLMVLGFFTMWFWLILKGVPVLGGKHMMGKFSALTIGVVVEFIPFLNVIPSITWWTWRMTTLSRLEDRERHRSGVVPAGTPTRASANDNSVVANDNEPAYAYGT